MIAPIVGHLSPLEDNYLGFNLEYQDFSDMSIVDVMLSLESSSVTFYDSQ